MGFRGPPLLEVVLSWGSLFMAALRVAPGAGYLEDSCVGVTVKL